MPECIFSLWDFGYDNPSIYKLHVKKIIPFSFFVEIVFVEIKIMVTFLDILRGFQIYIRQSGWYKALNMACHLGDKSL